MRRLWTRLARTSMHRRLRVNHRSVARAVRDLPVVAASNRGGGDRIMSTRTVRGARIFRFGEFELHVRSGELSRAGQRVRLQEQPYRILLMLLEHPGEVVLR